MSGPSYHAWEQPSTGSGYAPRTYGTTTAPVIINNNSGGSSASGFGGGWLLGHETSPRQTIVVPQGGSSAYPSQPAGGNLATVNCSDPGSNSANCTGFPSGGDSAPTSASQASGRAPFSGLPIDTVQKPKPEHHVVAYVIAGMLIALLAGMGLFLWRWQNLRTNATPESHYHL